MSASSTDEDVGLHAVSIAIAGGQAGPIVMGCSRPFDDPLSHTHSVGYTSRRFAQLGKEGQGRESRALARCALAAQALALQFVAELANRIDAAARLARSGRAHPEPALLPPRVRIGRLELWPATDLVAVRPVTGLSDTTYMSNLETLVLPTMIAPAWRTCAKRCRSPHEVASGAR